MHQIHDIWQEQLQNHLMQQRAYACICAVGSLHPQLAVPTHVSRLLTLPSCAELAAMRSLYAAVQLLLSRLLDFVASAHRAPAADSEGSAASMSRDRTSGESFASVYHDFRRYHDHDSLVLYAR